ncbi:pilin [Clostridium diolis]|uniref:prepilin-type N-terminal cleavage/methylation domain-containing protein n=1 Tax=Clostridium diolis TaxID=223919 RepID=UPI000B3F7507|nr:prepilin-type N-terminal cleavage/methylation domain-containing protein [Clostridium diolis]OVE70662.1 pilin [Clostridium diolis]
MNQLLKRKNNELSVKKKKGFTLIELIIVIAIIAILAAIAIPKFGAAKHNADVSADKANAKIIATAVANAAANGDVSPTTSYVNYIDGGVVPKPKSDTTHDWSIGYAPDGKGITVTLNGTSMYPIS